MARGNAVSFLLEKPARSQTALILQNLKETRAGFAQRMRGCGCRALGAATLRPPTARGHGTPGRSLSPAGHSARLVTLPAGHSFYRSLAHLPAAPAPTAGAPLAAPAPSQPRSESTYRAGAGVTPGSWEGERGGTGRDGGRQRPPAAGAREGVKGAGRGRRRCRLR